MSDVQLMHLVCQPCRWRPDKDQTVGLLEAHVATEHPEQVKEDGSPDVRLDMAVICPRCEIEVPLASTIVRADYVLYRHDCPRCHRSYRIKANP